MHPVEEGTVGLYQEPVAILDFASLYPSVFRAYNMSYDTLLHRNDASALRQDDVFTTPTGSCPTTCAQSDLGFSGCKVVVSAPQPQCSQDVGCNRAK